LEKVQDTQRERKPKKSLHQDFVKALWIQNDGVDNRLVKYFLNVRIVL
jgi:hypothetical protein